MKTLFLVGILSLIAYGECTTKVYRFDYEWSDLAEGWLKYHAVPATWDEARLRCQAEGAVLASPLSSELKSAVLSFVKKQHSFSPFAIFTGVHATFSKGDYTSIEGVPLLRLAVTWWPSEPDNLDNAESCLIMMIRSDGPLADKRCTDVQPYVCYKKYTKLTMNECGTSDPGYILDQRTGSCYKFHETGLVWSEAFRTCTAEGGYLAVINNNVEAEVVREIFSKHPEKNILSKYKSSLSVGFHDWGHRGSNFMTIHGEPLEDNYHNWAGGEPDNVTSIRTGDSGQYCGSIFRTGTLDDYYCNEPAAFLCEKSPDSLLIY